MDEPLSPDVVDLLKDLRINVQPGNNESTLNGSLELILHMLECVNALRQVNDIIPMDQLELTGGLFVKSQNEFSAAIGRILMFIMSTKPNPNLTELLQITVGRILHLFPESAAHDSYRNGTSLLHHAVSKAFADVRLVEVIHDANPICAGNPDNEGALPLHRAVANPDISLEVIKFLIAVYPAGTSSADLEGYLPLHWAVNTDRPNIAVIEELIDAYPDGCNTTCNMGSLPMHWAVDRPEPNMNVVYLLMKSYAKALRKGCSAGFLPIHRCVDRSNPSIACMKALIKKYPKSLEQDNCDGQLPLHRCVDRCDPSLEAVAFLIQAYPGALDTPDVEGYVPLHIALDGEEPSIPVVKLLIESCSESSTMKTQDGLLPLHYVLNCQDPSAELIALLLSSYPEGAEALAVDLYPEDPGADPLTWTGPWKKRKWTPLTRALELGQPHIVDMIRYAIESVRGGGGDGDHDRQRPVSNDSRRLKGSGGSRPRSNHSQPSRPSSHNSHQMDEATPLKTEHIPSTEIKQPPTSTVRGAAASNNYVNESTTDGAVGGARTFSPAGESPAVLEVQASAPIAASIPVAVPPKQLFPVVASANASVSSRNEAKEGRMESLPRVSPRATQPTQSASAESLFNKPAESAQSPQPEVEETPVLVPQDKRDARSRRRDRDSEEGGEGKDSDRKRRHRSKSRPRQEGEDGEEGEGKHKHRHHHRRHHRHHHRRREGEDTDEERRKSRHSSSRDKNGDNVQVRKPSMGSNGPGGDRGRDAPPRRPKGPQGGGGGIAMPVQESLSAQEADLQERMRKLELMEIEVARKEAEAQDAARIAYLKAREAEETLQRIQQNERDMMSRAPTESEKSEMKDEFRGSDYEPERANSHKFPSSYNASAPKFNTNPTRNTENDPDEILKSLEEFDKETVSTPTLAAVSHKFPPANTFKVGESNGSGGDDE